MKQHTQRRLENTTEPIQRESLLTTLAILQGKTAQIQVCGVVEHQMFEKKYLYENTIRSLQTAARSGLVPGGGSAYVALARKLACATAQWPEAERLGAGCLVEALGSVARTLADNAGDDGTVILQKLMESPEPCLGYDVCTHQMVDLKKAGILTPRDTAMGILYAAVDTAGSLWSTSAAVMEIT